MYKPIVEDANIVKSDGAEDTIFVTGWLSTGLFEYFSRTYCKEFTAMGHLYSRNPGVDYLVRNLLANPQVIYVVLFDLTPQDKVSGSVRAFYDFLRNGVTVVNFRNTVRYKVNSSIPNVFIGGDIPLEQLENLRQRLVALLVEDTLESLPFEKVRVHRQKQIIKPQLSPFLAPVMPLSKSQISENLNLPISKTFRGSMGQVWINILRYIITYGKGSPREVLNVISVIDDVSLQNDFVNSFPVGVYDLSNYTNSFVGNPPIVVGDSQVDYTYPTRMRGYFGVDQIEEMVITLKSDPDSRRAVVSLWDASKDINRSNPPCLTQISAKIHQDKLVMTAVFRSHDIYAAWISNVFALRYLQYEVAQSLNVDIGDLVVISQSAHIYDHSMSSAVLSLESAPIPNQTYDDPVGNFVITIEGKKIKVIWLSVDGEILETWTHKNPLVLGRAICAAVPQIKQDHLVYLGVELSKASHCLLNNIKYQQDR